MRNGIAPIALTLALATWWAGGAQQKWGSSYTPISDIARVESIVHTPESGTSILQSRIQRGVHWLCNYSRVEIERIIYNVTAKHCMVWANKFAYDIVAIQNFTEFYRSRWLSHIEYHAPTGVPWVRGVSPYTPQDIIGKELTVVGCFPDSTKQRMFCYKIIGSPYVSRDGHAVLYITETDQERILSHDSTRRRQVIAGMSGSPVFDHQWRLFWVLSMNAIRNTSTDGRNAIIIEPIRKPSWALATKLFNQPN